MSGSLNLWVLSKIWSANKELDFIIFPASVMFINSWLITFLPVCPMYKNITIFTISLINTTLFSLFVLVCTVLPNYILCYASYKTWFFEGFIYNIRNRPWVDYFSPNGVSLLLMYSLCHIWCKRVWSHARKGRGRCGSAEEERTQEDGDGVTARSSAVRQRGALISRRSPLPALRCVRYVIGLQTVLMSLCLNKPHQAFFNSAE